MLGHLKDAHIKELFSKAFLSFLLRSISAILLFILNIIISRALGADAAGYYFLSVSIVLVLTSIFRLGTDQVVTRLVSTYNVSALPKNISALYLYVMKFLGVSLFIISLFLFLFSDLISFFVFFKPDLTEPLRIISLSIFFLGLLVSHGFFFQGLKYTSAYQFCQNLGQPLFLFCIIVFSFFMDLELSTVNLSFFHLLSSIIPLLIVFFLLRSKLSIPTHAFIETKELWRSSLPLWGSASLIMLMNFGAPILLGVMGSSESVAIFYNAFRTASLVLLVLMSINSIAAPKFSELYCKNDIPSIRRLSIMSTRAMVLLTSPIFLCFFIFPEWVMGLFGSEFRVGYQVLVVLSLGQLFNVSTGSVLLILSMTGHERKVLLSSVISGLVMLFLCLTLIPLFGALGAAISYSLSLSLQMLMSTYFVYKALGFVPMSIFSKC